MKEKEMSVVQHIVFVGLGAFIGIVLMGLIKGMNAGITPNSLLVIAIQAAERTACIMAVFAVFHLIFKKYKTI